MFGRSNDRIDDGMTLIELLIAITILGLIIAPLTLALIISLNTAKATQQQVTDSTGAQLLSAYFPADVQSADTVKTASFQCGTGNIVEFSWTDAKTAAVTVVDYESVAGDGDNSLRRVAFAPTVSGCGSPTASDLLVHNLDQTAPPAITCRPSSDCSTVTQVDLDVTAFAHDAAGVNPYGKYQIHLTGTRRAS